jgi:hypothetical protein
LVLEIWRTSNHTEAAPAVLIKICNQAPVRLLIGRLRAPPISRIAGRDDGKASVLDFIRSNRALKMGGPVEGIHGLSLRMAKRSISVSAAGFICRE